MAKGGSKIGGGGGSGTPVNSDLLKQARANIKGVSGYSVTTQNGDNVDFYFAKSNDGATLYGNAINDTTTETPNGWNASQMMNAIEQNGGTAKKYTHSELLQTEIDRLNDRDVTNAQLNNAVVRNAIADSGNRSYRSGRQSARAARRK